VIARVWACLIGFALTLAVACAQPAPPMPPRWAEFSEPQPVRILGYNGDAMEPFLSRDGQTLFFNNRNHPPERTDLHWAERVDDLTFRYRGRVDGANSDHLDGVATLSRNGRFCFVSPRTYFETLASVYCGQWTGRRVENASLQRGLSDNVLGRLIFDVEIAASGESVVFADGVFDGGPAPTRADLRAGAWRGGGLVLAPERDATLRALNTSALEYAPALSSDELTIAFTRAEGRPPFVQFGIWLARRERLDEPFGPPVRIEAIRGGLFEAAAFSPDDRALYYHRLERERYSLWRVALR
jgi:hypothetical protein